MNKYNIEVGDTLTLINDYPVKSVDKDGIKFSKDNDIYLWPMVNSRLDKGDWILSKKLKLPTEYKVGDVVSFEAYGVYKIEGRYTPSALLYTLKNCIIKNIEGDLFRLRGGSTLWFKLSDLPPKTENMKKFNIGDIVTDDNGRNLYKIRSIEGDRIYVKGEKHYLGLNRRLATPEEIKKYNMQEYKVGDVVITEGYTSEYDGKPLEITNIFTQDFGTYCNFKPSNSPSHNFRISEIKRLATPEEIKQYNMKGKKIIGYKLIKPEYEKAAIAITGFTEGVDSFYDYMLRSNSGFAQTLRTAGVLDSWFEPVYEPEKPKEVKLTIGFPYRDAVVDKNGVTVSKYFFSPSEIEDIGQLLGEKESAGGLTVYVRKLWIGCSNGCEITKKDIDAILKAFEDLKK